MHVEEYYADQDPSGMTTWRYHVTDQCGDRWNVEVYGGAARFYWIVTGESHPDVVDSRQEAYEMAGLAFDAAITQVRKRSAGDSRS